MRIPSITRSSDSESPGDPAGSVLPATASTGAIVASSTSTSKPPTSPAWRMSSTPASASKMSARTRPCVSETRPMTRRLTSGTGWTCSGGPPAREVVLDGELVQYTRDDERHQVVDRCGAVIEAGSRRKHDRASPRDSEHVLKVYRAQRRLTRNQYELPPLLERDVRRSLDQRSR